MGPLTHKSGQSSHGGYVLAPDSNAERDVVYTSSRQEVSGGLSRRVCRASKKGNIRRTASLHSLPEAAGWGLQMRALKVFPAPSVWRIFASRGCSCVPLILRVTFPALPTCWPTQPATVSGGLILTQTGHYDERHEALGLLISQV